MAHKITVVVTPHKNKDGSESKSKKDYEVWDRSRGNKTRVGVATSQKGAQELIDEHRMSAHTRHLLEHPNDLAFQNKHKIVEVSK